MSFTPRAKRVLELAVREALSRGDAHVGSEHILLGIVRDDDGLAVQLLEERGVTLERVRDAVVAALPPPKPGPAPRSVFRRARRSAVHQLRLEVADIEEALRRRHDADEPLRQPATG